MGESGQSKRVCLQVLPSLIAGGVERGTIDVAQALVNAGWTALVASTGGPMVRELERVGAVHIGLPLKSKSPLNIRRNVDALVELMAHRNVSVVHARSRAPAWSAMRAAEKLSIPFVTTFHGTYGLGPFGLKKAYNRVMAEGDIVIAISEFIRTHIIGNYGVPADKIRLIHRGVDVQSFDPAAVTSVRLIQLAQKWRLSESTRVIMLPGRITGWKGHRLLIDALAVMKQRAPNATDLRCMMVGPTETPHLVDALLSYAEEKGVGGWVQIVQDCNDIPAAYMITDVAVSASTDPEAFGRVVAEAQAMGRPVVAPAHGAAPEIIEPGVTGWLFTPRDPVSLADAMERALNLSQSERERLAARAIERVRKYFNKTDMCAKTLAVYDEVLARKSPR
ncbi:MAG: glycosyltransferase family 4 protein [Rhodospirillaceae bacterium]|nr:glycosyltransferase family 4 protein [Rhodospirillaceae bacterium]